MEELKARIPKALAQRIRGSREADLASTAVQASAFFDQDHVFHQFVKPLSEPNETVCAKDLAEALRHKLQGNELFNKNAFEPAVSLYTKALQYLPSTPAASKDAAVIYTNRASCFQRLGLLYEGERDCSRAILRQESYSKAWYRRGCIRAEMLSFEGALQDLEVAAACERSSMGKKQVEKLIEDVKNQQTSSKEIQPDESSSFSEEQALNTEVYWAPGKGQGLRTLEEAQPGALALVEEASAAILLKEHRRTRCHFCFELLPADSVPCKGCAVPLYCSDACGNGAAAEHRHECGGTSWASVLPPDAVLACRIFNGFLETDGLCHHYDELSGTTKLELHLLAIVLEACLKPFSREAAAASKIVLLIARVRANVMAITHVSSGDLKRPEGSICGIDHVRVAQGLFLRGSKFNHSCNPIVHASYVKRRLYVHVTRYAPSNTPLELSYGPEIGGLGKHERQQWLQERYFFVCKCEACTQAFDADVLLEAYRCNRVRCDGAVTKEQAEVFRCLKCGLMMEDRDIMAAARSLQDMKALGSIILEDGHQSGKFLEDARRCLDIGKRYFHPFNKCLGEMEDVMARLYSSANEPLLALQHSRQSLEILKRLYGAEHIAIAYELVKLVSLARQANDQAAANASLDAADKIFKSHYGKHNFSGWLTQL